MSDPVLLVNEYETPERITVDGRGLAEAIVTDADLANALAHQMSFNLHDAAVTPTAANDYYAKLANVSEWPMVIHRLRLNDATGEVNTLEVGPNFESATSHAELEPVNRSVGSVVKASDFGEFESDVDITGMESTLTEVERVKTVSGVDYELDLRKAPIILGQNECLCLKAVTGGIAKSYSVYFFFQRLPLVNG